MRVPLLRKVLEASATIQEKAGQAEVADRLKRLAEAIKPADRLSVSQLLDKLPRK